MRNLQMYIMLWVRVRLKPLKPGHVLLCLNRFPGLMHISCGSTVVW